MKQIQTLKTLLLLPFLLVSINCDSTTEVNEPEPIDYSISDVEIDVTKHVEINSENVFLEFGEVGGIAGMNNLLQITNDGLLDYQGLAYKVQAKLSTQNIEDIKSFMEDNGIYSFLDEYARDPQIADGIDYTIKYVNLGNTKTVIIGAGAEVPATFHNIRVELQRLAFELFSQASGN